jgi:ribonuclease VapC
MSIVPFSRDMTDIAANAYAQFGRRSGHPARLNFGDCMAYAASAVLRAPLLFKGADFAHTDVMAHPASIKH